MTTQAAIFPVHFLTLFYLGKGSQKIHNLGNLPYKGNGAKGFWGLTGLSAFSKFRIIFGLPKKGVEI